MNTNGFVFNSHFFPREIVTHILDFVDVRHDILRCRSVCKHWNDIITGELWKKKLAEQKNLKSFSTMSVQEKCRLNYPWFIYREIFINDPFSHNLIENFVDLGCTSLKRQAIDLRKCGISYFMMNMRPKITINVRIPTKIGNDKPYEYRVVIKLFNQFNEKLHTAVKTVTCEKYSCEFTIEMEEYNTGVRYIEICQHKRSISHYEFLPPNADVDIQLSAPQFCEKEWNIVSSDELWRQMIQTQSLASFSKISSQEKANLRYPWFVAKEIFDHDPYEKNLVESEKDLYYEFENVPMKYGFWRVITEKPPTPDTSFLSTSSSKMYLVQTICLRDHGIFGFLLDNEQPAINVDIVYPNFGSSTLFEWHLYNRIKVSLLNDKEEVLQEKSIFEENKREKNAKSLKIKWIFEKYGVGVRYIEICVGCKFIEPPYPFCPDLVLPSVEAEVTLPQLKKS